MVFQSATGPAHLNNKPPKHQGVSKVGVVVPQTLKMKPSASHTVVKQGHEYQIIDPELKDQTNLYTSPKLNNIADVSGNPSGLEVSQSGTYYYCNERKYQALSPDTKDYMSLYSTPARKQDHKGETQQ